MKSIKGSKESITEKMRPNPLPLIPADFFCINLERMCYDYLRNRGYYKLYIDVSLKIKKYSLNWNKC